MFRRVVERTTREAAASAGRRTCRVSSSMKLHQCTRTTSQSVLDQLIGGQTTSKLSLKTQKPKFRFTVSSSLSTEAPQAGQAVEENTSEDKDKNTEPITPDETIPPDGTDKNNSSKIESLEKDLKEMKEKVLRSLAEEENVRRIAKRDVDNAKAYANEKFAKALLEVADNLDYAIKAAASTNDDEGTTQKDPMDNRTNPVDSATLLKNLLEGVEATNRGLLKSFAQFGVVKYGAVGEKFDPQLHDALFQVPTNDLEVNTIAQVLQPGYKMKERVLRAAQVGTAKKPE